MKTKVVMGGQLDQLVLRRRHPKSPGLALGAVALIVGAVFMSIALSNYSHELFASIVLRSGVPASLDQSDAKLTADLNPIDIFNGDTSFFMTMRPEAVERLLSMNTIFTDCGASNVSCTRQPTWSNPADLAWNVESNLKRRGQYPSDWKCSLYERSVGLATDELKVLCASASSNSIYYRSIKF